LIPEPPAEPVLYSVTATLPSQGVAAEYVAWLRSGHLQDVVRAGALSAAAARLIEPRRPIQVESSYVFASRDAFDRYVRDHADRLRAQGLAVFGPHGVTFERRLAIILADTRTPLDGAPSSPA